MLWEGWLETRSDPPSAEARPAPGRPGRGCAGVALALALFLCLASCTLAGIGLAANGRVSGGPVRLGSGIMEVCAGVVTQPRFQAGLGWQSMVMSVMPPPVVYSPYAMCVGMPMWPPFFPYRGEWLFPP